MTHTVFALAVSLTFAMDGSAQARKATAAAELEECRKLVRLEAFNMAVEQCERAVQANPRSATAHFTLASVYQALASEFQTPEVAAAEKAQNLRRRTQAIDSYKKGLVAAGRGPSVRAERRAGLAALVRLYVSADENGDDVIAYAEELARETPLDVDAAIDVARVYVNNGRFEDGISTLERSAAATPKEPGGYHAAATFLWEKAYRDLTLSNNAKLKYVERALAHEDRALALKSDFVEALVYKGLLLRLKASAISDPAQQKQLIEEASALQARAMPSASTPLRVGGEIEPPAKLKDVRPIYPPVAISARITGVVIVEATIGTDGTVTDAQVTRSIPLLDAAALDAVKQWVFAPTYLNGIAVPVIMTVTVNFSLK